MIEVGKLVFLGECETGDRRSWGKKGMVNFPTPHRAGEYRSPYQKGTSKGRGKSIMKGGRVRGKKRKLEPRKTKV